MHYRLELIAPAGTDIEKALNYLQEEPPHGIDPNGDDWDEDWIGPGKGILDGYEIGGRWTGAHVKALHNKEQIDHFYSLLKDLGVKQCGVQMGKPTLASHSPAEIDALWRETFPDSPLPRCPIFDYARFEDLDIVPVKDLSPTDTAAVVYIVNDTNGHVHRWMRQRSLWNGINIENTNWDGNIRFAIVEHNQYVRNWTIPLQVTDDWLATTIDIHS